MPKGFSKKYPKLFEKLDIDDAVILRIFFEEIEISSKRDVVSIRDTIVGVLHTIYPDIQSVKNKLGIVDYEKIALRLINDTCYSDVNHDGTVVVYFYGMNKFQQLQKFREQTDAMREREHNSIFRQSSLFEIMGSTHEESLEIINQKYYPVVIDNLSAGSINLIKERNLTSNTYLGDEFETELKNVISKAINQNVDELQDKIRDEQKLYELNIDGLKLNNAFLKLIPKKKKENSKPILSSEDAVFCYVDRIRRGITWDEYFSDVVPDLKIRNVISLSCSQTTLSNKSSSEHLSVILKWLLAVSSRGLSINERFDILVYSEDCKERHTKNDLGYFVIAIQGRAYPHMISSAYICTDITRYGGIDKSEDAIKKLFKPELNEMFLIIYEENEIISNPMNRESDIVNNAAELEKQSSLIDIDSAESILDNIIGDITARSAKKNKETKKTNNEELKEMTIVNEIYAKLLIYNLNKECEMKREGKSSS